MPYVIVVVILIVGAGAFFVMQPADEVTEDEVTAQEVARIDADEDDADIADDDTVEPDDDTTEVAANGMVIGDLSGPTPEPLDTPVVDQSAEGATGSFSGEASYSTGRSIHELLVTLTLENDIVVASDIRYDGQGEPTTPTLRSFNDAYEAEVIGKDIDDIELSRVGGASWTSDAFNEAVDTIQQQAS